MPRQKRNELATATAAPPINTAAVDEVFGWIVRGDGERKIVDAIRQHWPDDQPVAIIADAMRRLDEVGQADATVLVGWCLEATRLIYRTALEKEDLETALKSVAQLHRIASR